MTANSEMLSPTALMRKPAWRATINPKSIADDNEGVDAADIDIDDIQRYADTVAKKIHVLNDELGKNYTAVQQKFPNYVTWDREDESFDLDSIAENFEMLAESYDATIEDFNMYLSDLYDLGDAYRFWVKFAF